MQTVEQLKAKQAAELAKLEAANALAALLPIPPKMAFAERVTGTPFVCYDVDGVAGAIEAIKLFTVVPFTEYRNGSLKLCPMQFVPEEKRDVHAGQWALQIDVKHHFFSHCGAGTTATIKFFARVQGVDVPVHIWLDIKGQGYIGSMPKWAPTASIKRGRFGHESGGGVERGSVRANVILSSQCQRTITWGTGGDDWANHSYLVSADYADQDATPDELTHALAVLENLQ